MRYSSSVKFAVLSSSHGTTFQAILEAVDSGSLTAECIGLITDRADRGCIDKAKVAHLPFIIVEKKVGESREAYDQRLDAAIRSLGEIDVVAAIGWMFVLTAPFIAKWRNKILNVHPALLPKYGGAGMYGERVHRAVLDAGDKESGMTIHLMDEGVDSGKILLQKTCPVLPGDTVETLKSRVQALEREWYPRVLQMIEEKKLRNY